ncbi:hypothetical protein F5878DRAFT_623537 [Lentinula raphanica]|uniref:Uncharacterized protein n=1 Tax=Lentinula raphanica TaxID=153919 RepID=A0AA38P6I4_9AGAR|nr:hypothetical protein F5878DRAFT_623537 [Lentinula raphanica]
MNPGFQTSAYLSCHSVLQFLFVSYMLPYVHLYLILFTLPHLSCLPHSVDHLGCVPFLYLLPLFILTYGVCLST